MANEIKQKVLKKIKQKIEIKKREDDEPFVIDIEPIIEQAIDLTLTEKDKEIEKLEDKIINNIKLGFAESGIDIEEIVDSIDGKFDSIEWYDMLPRIIADCIKTVKNSQLAECQKPFTKKELKLLEKALSKLNEVKEFVFTESGVVENKSIENLLKKLSEVK